MIAKSLDCHETTCGLSVLKDILTVQVLRDAVEDYRAVAEGFLLEVISSLHL